MHPFLILRVKFPQRHELRIGETACFSPVFLGLCLFLRQIDETGVHIFGVAFDYFPVGAIVGPPHHAFLPFWMLGAVAIGPLGEVHLLCACLIGRRDEALVSAVVEMAVADGRRIPSYQSAVFGVLNQQLLYFAIPRDNMLENAEIVVASPLRRRQSMELNPSFLESHWRLIDGKRNCILSLYFYSHCLDITKGRHDQMVTS